MNTQSINFVGTLFVATLVAAGPAAAGTLDPLSAHLLQGSDQQYQVGDAPTRDIRVDVWTDVSEDEIMERGEEFTLSFQTNADLYVVIYKIDVDGRVEVVWPASRYSDGFVYGNHSYQVPRPGQDARMRVGNVKGVEYIEAIASAYPFDLRSLGIDFRFDRDERSRHDYYIDGDPFLAVNDINYAITGLEEDVDYVVTDWVHLYVEEQVEYARYSCNQCHLDDSGHPTVDVYVDTCPQVEVRVDWGWHRAWSVSFGWYPLYYEPPSYYWDYQWSRPYWYAWYPVPYRWPAYSCYTRPYPVYWWKSSGYWQGDYASQWSSRRTRSVPLYDVERVRGRTTTVATRDGTRRTVLERPVSARGTGASDGRRVDRDVLVRNSRPPAQVDRRSTGSTRTRGTDVAAIDNPGRSDTQRGTIRTDRGARDRIVSKRPVEGTVDRRRDGRTSPTTGGGDAGRRWTRPKVRNDRPATGSGGSVRGSRDRTPRQPAVDRSSSQRGQSPSRRNVVDRPSSKRSSGTRSTPPRQVDRGKSRSSSGGGKSAVKPRSAPKSQPKPQPKPAPKSRSGTGSSRSRGGGGRG